MGSGIKTFTNGEVLDADDVNGYLMRQSVVTCTSGNPPSSPTTGQPIYETDTKLVRVWDGSDWHCPASPEYTPYTPTFYSNASTGATIPGGSVTVTYCYYQKVNTRVHYYGHAQINTTTASGFALGLPFPTPFRSFSLSTITLHGPSTTYDALFGDGHVPTTSAPYNRVTPVSRSNAFGNVASSGDTCHWNIVYESE